MKRTLLSVTAAAAALAASAAVGHHSAAMFDNTKQLTLTGTVREFQWTSPHCYLQLLVGTAGSAAPGRAAPQEWSLEMAAPMYLYQLGWRPSTVKAGDRITVKINPLRNGERGGLLIQVTTADGRQFGNGKS